MNVRTGFDHAAFMPNEQPKMILTEAERWTQADELYHLKWEENVQLTPAARGFDAAYPRQDPSLRFFPSPPGISSNAAYLNGWGAGHAVLDGLRPRYERAHEGTSQVTGQVTVNVPERAATTGNIVDLSGRILTHKINPNQPLAQFD